MEGLLDRLTTLGVVLGFWAICYIVRLFAGFKNVRKQMKSWNWCQFRDGLFDRFCWLIATAGAVVACEMLKWLMPSIGITFSPEVTLLLDTASVIAIPFVNGVADLVLGIRSIQASSGWENNVKALEADVTNITNIQYNQIAKDTYNTIGNILETVFQSKESVDNHQEYEAEGGRGTYYNLPISSYDSFRNAVNGKGYNVDGAYGAQCWDGCALLWQQLGSNLITGNGCASGCWTLKRDVNTGTNFVQVANREDVKRGDVVVFSMGEFGHIGFADEDYNGSGCIKLLGQNQGGVAYPGGGSNFNIINCSMATFLGAFRYKQWNSATAAPAPTVSKKEQVENLEIKEGGRAKVIKRVDVNGTALLSMQDTYQVMQVGPQTIPNLKNTAVLTTDDGRIYARLPLANLKKV